jgi:hypothetical protein
MTTYVWREGKLVEKSLAEPLVKNTSQSALGFPMFISDELPDTKSMASGKIYSSKSALRAEYKRLGMIEIGNDTPVTKPKVSESVKTSAIKAYKKLQEGYKPEIPMYDSYETQEMNILN